MSQWARTRKELLCYSISTFQLIQLSSNLFDFIFFVPPEESVNSLLGFFTCGGYILNLLVHKIFSYPQKHLLCLTLSHDF